MNGKNHSLAHRLEFDGPVPFGVPFEEELETTFLFRVSVAGVMTLASAEMSCGA